MTRRLTEVEPLLPKRGLILDYGAGDGLFSRFLVEASSERRAVAVEPDLRRLDIATRLHNTMAEERITFLSSLPRVGPEPRFDAIVILDVLYLIAPAARIELAQTLGTLLKPGGVMVLKELVHPLRGIGKMARWQEILMLNPEITSLGEQLSRESLHKPNAR